MRQLLIVTVGIAAVLLPAPALAAEPQTCTEPGRLDPVGDYEFEADMGGMELQGVISIECTEEGLRGLIQPEGAMPGLDIVGVSIDEQEVVLSTEQMGGEGPDFILDFDGDSFTGVVVFQGIEDSISGRRITEQD